MQSTSIWFHLPLRLVRVACAVVIIAFQGISRSFLVSRSCALYFGFRALVAGCFICRSYRTPLILLLLLLVLELSKSLNFQRSHDFHDLKSFQSSQSSMVSLHVQHYNRGTVLFPWFCFFSLLFDDEQFLIVIPVLKPMWRIPSWCFRFYIPFVSCLFSFFLADLLAAMPSLCGLRFNAFAIMCTAWTLNSSN